MSDIVNAARRRVESLSPQQVANELSCGADLLLVDVREADELDATGRIDRAVHVPRGMLEFRADPTRTLALAELRPERPVILYSESGGRSALAAAALQDIGYERVAHLDGGLRAWRDSGFATTSDVELVADDDHSARHDRVPRPCACRSHSSRHWRSDQSSQESRRPAGTTTRDWHPPSRRRRPADSTTHS